MFKLSKPGLYEFSPQELQEVLMAGAAVLVDVREPNEYAASRIAGAVNLPLSGFDPVALPAGEIVLHCAGGKRSAMAADFCAKAGVPIRGHLAGGIAAWSACGLPVARG